MRALIAILLLIGFGLLVHYGWKNNQHQAERYYELGAIHEAQRKQASEDHGPMAFYWEEVIPSTNDSLKIWLETYTSGMQAGRRLVIAAPYFRNERNLTDFENLGMARAYAIQQLIKEDIPEELTEIKGYPLDFYAEAKQEPLTQIRLDWRIRNENIVELEEGALIYFPKNSYDREMTQNIKDYLQRVVKALENNQKKVILTGYTDNVGSAQSNQNISRLRAERIKQELVSLGVDADRIFTQGAGMENPIASNTTEAGRHENRRVELKIQ
ncbi:OmpA family protein [Croceiramulus getboli]|nr:OmpA family protein [Flavobacteriaceae bacterium YJPT1-3]